MQHIKCRCCYRLLGKASHFHSLEIKCPRCKTINMYMSTPSTLPDCLEQQKHSGKTNEQKFS